MFDCDTNLPHQIVEALKHHQRNVDDTKEAQKKLAMMRQIAAQIEKMQNANSEN